MKTVIEIQFLECKVSCFLVGTMVETLVKSNDKAICAHQNGEATINGQRKLSYQIIHGEGCFTKWCDFSSSGNDIMIQIWITMKRQNARDIKKVFGKSTMQDLRCKTSMLLLRFGVKNRRQ